jgi:hypothetical protein
MMQQMTSRERNLAFIVGLLVVGLICVMLGKTFTRNHKALKVQLMDKTSRLASMKTMINERDLWVERSQIISSTQPKLENAATAGVNFLKELENLAKEHSVMLELPQVNSVLSKPHYQSVSVVFETKSSGPQLVDFMKAAQGPSKFTVFTIGSIEVAKNDPTQMQGKFTAERWFAPK